MDDSADDDGQRTREDNRFTTELYMYILQNLARHNFVRISEIKKIYNKTAAKDRTVRFRRLHKILDEVQQRLWFYMKWKLTYSEDRITMVNMLDVPPVQPVSSDEAHRLNGILRVTLMYIFMAKNPNAKNPNVSQEDLFQFMEKVCSKNLNGTLDDQEAALLKKLIGPNNKALFVKRGWISFTKSTNENDEEVFRYEWGPVAKQTVDATKLIELYQKHTEHPVRGINAQALRAIDEKIHQIDAVKLGVSSAFKGRNRNNS